MLIYDFDTLGIIYTAALGGLSLLMLIPLIRFLAKKKQSTAGTVLFRVIDFVLLAVVLAGWCAYVLTKVRIFGVGLIPGSDGAMDFALNDEVLFSLPGAGGMIGVWETALGTGLLALLTLLALLDLILSFALRRGRRDIVVVVGEGTVLSETHASAADRSSGSDGDTAGRAGKYDDIPADGQNMLFERMRFGDEKAEPETERIVSEAEEENIPLAEVKAEEPVDDKNAIVEVADESEIGPVEYNEESAEAQEVTEPVEAPEEEIAEENTAKVQTEEELIADEAARLEQPVAEESAPDREPAEKTAENATAPEIIFEAEETEPDFEPAEEVTEGASASEAADEITDESVAEEASVNAEVTESAEEDNIEAVSDDADGGEKVAAYSETKQPAASAVEARPAAAPAPAVFGEYVEVSRLGGNVSDKTYSSAVQRPGEKKKEPKRDQPAAETEQEGLKPGEEKLAVKMPPLPVTRKLVITNRMNVVNMFNSYLNDKEKTDREKLSDSISKIIIK